MLKLDDKYSIVRITISAQSKLDAIRGVKECLESLEEMPDYMFDDGGVSQTISLPPLS